MRIKTFDIIKAIAIIAVVLYHIGVSTYGYLGVDTFLVVAGYFTAISLQKRKLSNWGGYFSFVTNRVFRLWPLMLVAGTVSLAYGYFFMLPDDFENTAQSVIASNLFANNILQAITTKNYWDVINEFKPLMHTWYVGVLVQFYLVIPLVLLFIQRAITEESKTRKITILVISIISLISLLLYLFSEGIADKFYYLPFRLFEFGCGMLIVYTSDTEKDLRKNIIYLDVAFAIGIIILLSLFFINSDVVNSNTKLIITVCITSMLLWLIPRTSISKNIIFSNKYIALIGASSYSIFVWHQIVFAFARYSISCNLTSAPLLMIIFAIITILCVLSYKYIESLKPSKTVWWTLFALFTVTMGYSMYLYSRAGVVRDIPELNVKMDNVHRGMWAEYCDRGYKYDRDFSSNERPKWYVIGNSFGRDFVNIVAESSIADSVDIVYSDPKSFVYHSERFQKADLVILSWLGLTDKNVSEIQSYCPQGCRIIIIGEKNFGENNGQIYCQRFRKDYHKLTIEMEKGYAQRNKQHRAAYAGMFVDLISLVQQPDGRVKVFTDDCRFISQDCRHLTKAGAQYYAKLIDWDFFLNPK